MSSSPQGACIAPSLSSCSTANRSCCCNRGQHPRYARLLHSLGQSLKLWRNLRQAHPCTHDLHLHLHLHSWTLQDAELVLCC